jgi:hypothetical protein
MRSAGNSAIFSLCALEFAVPARAQSMTNENEPYDIVLKGGRVIDWIEWAGRTAHAGATPWEGRSSATKKKQWRREH